MSEPTGQWLSLAQAARYLGVGRRSIDRWAASGRLKFYRLPGGERRFKREDLDAIMRPGESPEEKGDD